jgi:hypothetical protein
MTPYGGHIRPPEGVTVDPLFLWLCNEMGGFGIRANPGRELSTSSSYCAVRPLPPTRIRRIAPFAMSSRIVRGGKPQRYRRRLPPRVIPARLLPTGALVIPALQRHVDEKPCGRMAQLELRGNQHGALGCVEAHYRPPPPTADRCGRADGPENRGPA